MRFDLNMKLTNADALDPDDDNEINPYAVTGYLRGVAARVEGGTLGGSIQDGNGATIGAWAITDDAAPARVPVDMDLFKSSAPAFNCIAYPGEGMHYRPYVPQGPRVCWWCGEV